MRGHVLKRGTKWSFVVDVGRTEEGRRKQRWQSGFATKRDAQDALTETLSRLKGGNDVAPSKVTVAAFMRQWLAGLPATVRPSTVEGYRNLAEGHIIPRLGPLALQKVTPAHLNAFYADLLAKGRKNGKGGLSPRTVFYAHATIRKALAEALKHQLVLRNVADLATPPRQSEGTEMRVWTAAELRLFLDHIAADRLVGAYTLAATSGMRRGEVLGLRWRDLDLDGARLSVTQTVISVNYAVMTSAPKTARGRRSVALDPTTVEALKAHRTRQLAERVALGIGRPAADDLVFSNPDASPVNPAQFSDRFDRLVKAAGVPRIRFHDLRHTHATLALLAGIPAKVVSDRLGHSTVAITLDTYSHVLPALQEDAATKVAALVFGT
jgi:integrase